MADTKLSDLPAATTPLAGTELVYIVQSGDDAKATAQDIADLAPASPAAPETFSPFLLMGA
jgi:hypothetical protein